MSIKSSQSISTNLEEIISSINKDGASWHRFEHLAPYCQANLTTLASFLQHYAHRIPSSLRTRQFSLFLDDADERLEDSLAFSPPQNKNNLAIVDPIMIRSHFYIRRLMETCANASPFEKRLSKAYWRGALTGRPANSPHEICKDFDSYFSLICGEETSLQRVRLCRLSRESPDFLDCKITSTTQWLHSEKIYASLKDEMIISSEEPFEANLAFKYVIDIDGNSNSWPGFFMKLGTGSCVLKVESSYSFHQWYYKYLSPWKHYVPVMPDMSDLIDKIRHLKEHDSIAEEISCRARAFILSRSPEEWAQACLDDLLIGIKMRS